MKSVKFSISSADKPAAFLYMNFYPVNLKNRKMRLKNANLVYNTITEFKQEMKGV